ncbi:substrate-binding domain-containing protein [Caldilinea sp.]|uniref:substrate-binding domain-containing protein n=1 Tax=Caldilinea sp. TaxID=2293560 RepID=UPI002CC45135|nr:extracellular solute-binding protein [Anaerolineales bacterium]HQY92183.1 substrate-binding domain-containing protein [Caldilinea sp.]HRA65357.1 substrate-binding domain-containing protein [Caldilinea sp.]
MTSDLSRRTFLKFAGYTGVALGLAACAPAATPSTGAAPNAGAAAPAAEPVKLLVTMVDYFDSTKEALDQQILPAFAEIHPEITVDINYTAWNKYNEELTTAFAGGVTPDLMQGGAIFVPQFAYRDWILPLDDYIETADEWNWEDFMPSTRDDVTIDGQVLAIPYRLDVRTPWYREDLLAEVGYTAPPATWAELREMAKAATIRDGDEFVRTGFHFPPNTINWQNDFQVFVALLAAAGGKLLNEDNTQSLLAEPESLETADFLRTLVLEDQSAMYPPFENQGELSALHTGKGVLTISNEGPEIAARLYAPETLPLLKAAPPAANKEARTHVWINKFFISKLTTKPDATWALLQFITLPEQLAIYTGSFNSLAPRISLADADFVTENMRVMAKAAETATVYPKYHRMAEIFRPTAQALEAILRGEKSVEVAMQEAADAVNNILAE